MKLPLARYRYTYRMAEPLRLPHYAGSLLRGQFGAALRRISCLTGAAKCDGCPLRPTCPYSAVFEAPAPANHTMQRFSHIPNPYVVEPPPIGTTSVGAGKTLSFNLVLFGRALERLPLINLSLQRAVEQGLGPDRARGILEHLEVQCTAEAGESTWSRIWQRGDAAIAPHDTETPFFSVVSEPAAVVTQATFLFDTPLRLQHQGQPVRPHALSPRKFVADLLRRITLLAEFHAGRPNFVTDAAALVHHAGVLKQQHDLRWHDWSRYSSRQQQEMKLGGALGTWTWIGNLDPLLPWLRLGQWLHVGKNATLGLGAYRLDTMPASTPLMKPDWTDATVPKGLDGSHASTVRLPASRLCEVGCDVPRTGSHLA